MMRALELLQLVKRHISGRVMLNSKKINTIALAVNEGVNQSHSWSIEKFVKQGIHKIS